MLLFKVLKAFFLFVLCVEFSFQNGASSVVDKVDEVFEIEARLDIDGIDIKDDIEFKDGIEFQNDIVFLDDAGFQENTEFGGGHDQSHHFRMMDAIIRYVMMKGCSYVMGFVKGKYFHNHHTQPMDRSNCDWRLYVQRACVSHHVPPELCCAMMDCGISYSLAAVCAPKETIARCNMTSAIDSMRGTSSIESRRSLPAEPSPAQIDPLGMCAGQPHITDIFGKRRIPMNSTVEAENSNSAIPNYQSSHTDIGNFISTLLKAWSDPSQHVMPTSPPLTPSMKNWCVSFSRSIHKRYDFKTTKFIPSSVYWIVDIYKIGHEHHVPTNYTHGLVGCGMSYALQAFNAESWQTLLYKLVV